MRTRVNAAIILAFLALNISGCATHDPAQVRQEAYQAYQDGDYLAAADRFRTLVEVLPRDAELWFRLGNSYARAMFPQQAIEAYQNALLRDPSLGKAWYNMGLIHMQAALKAFVDMQDYVSEDDPAAVKGKMMRDGLFTLLEPEENREEQE